LLWNKFTIHRDLAYYCIIGWVNIGIGTKGKRRFVVLIEKVWKITKIVSEINRPLSQRSLFSGACTIFVFKMDHIGDKKKYPSFCVDF
jgi:hypothetical protein